MATYLLSVHLDAERPPMTPARQEQAYRDTGVFNQGLREIGALVFAAGLVPADEARVIDATGPSPITTPGTFIAGTRRLGGFWIVTAPDDATAEGWAHEASVACNEPVELRAFR
jgi:hypothetical protein